MEAEKKRVKVIITAHVPPGYFERQHYGPFYDYKAGHAPNEIYVDIINAFGHVVSRLLIMDYFADFLHISSKKLPYFKLNFNFKEK